MHRIVPAIIALVVACLGDSWGAEPGARERTFVRALEVFDAAKAPADYRESAALLESLLADGFKNGAVFYNLGNAYFRAGEYGRSIAAYRRPSRTASGIRILMPTYGKRSPSLRAACPNRLLHGGVTYCSGAAGYRFPRRRTRRSRAFCWPLSRPAQPCFSVGHARIG